MNRPVIIVDLDNVVYDWVQAMATWLDKNGVLNLPDPYESGLAISWKPTGQVTRALTAYSQWAVWDDWNIPKGEFMRWWRLGIEAGEIYAKGPIIAGARDALWRLSDAEWSIFIATSRLTKFGAYDRIVANTAAWLNENNIPYRDLAFTSQKYNILADAIVDDRADNMSAKVHKQMFLFDAPHNKNVNLIHYTWPEIVEELVG